VEISPDIEALLDDGYEQVDGQGDPYLALDRVLGGIEERLDAQVLFDPFEKQLVHASKSVVREIPTLRSVGAGGG
jgi:hypothetical protein